MDSLHIGGFPIGPHHEPFIIAEIGQAHDGSLGMAHAYIDAVADAGGRAIKFQTHIAEAESTPGEPFRVKFSKQDATRFEYWKRMEFTESQWAGLYDHTKERGMAFISSPFSVEAVELLARTGVDAYKIGSGETNNPHLMRAMARHGKPVLVSSGMSTWDEIHDAVNLVASLQLPVGLFQCTSMYPTPHDKVGLNVLREMRERFSCPVGLSDHTGHIYSSLAAVSHGANLLEVHVVFHKGLFGPDVSSSLTFDQFAQLNEGANAIFEIERYPLDKDAMAEELGRMRQLFNKSVAVRKAVNKGEVLTAENLTVKKPGTGIPAGKLEELVGMKVLRDVAANSLLQIEDLEA